MGATSYVLNDLVFDDYEFNRLLKIPCPSRTIHLFILSERRVPSTTRDHIHGAEWTSWTAALNDIEPDRHRVGARAPDRMRGSANYLFADGHVENHAARDFKTIFDQGINPASVPKSMTNQTKNSEPNRTPATTTAFASASTFRATANAKPPPHTKEPPPCTT